ncbi:MAG: glycerophosphodiester phosphodiesterase [Anaerolineales bacterium]|nr:glycerophosphodiester phosphodiesterase [Anaerolineales bacterium]
MTTFEIVAHRGAPGPAPENTIPAFVRAIELGADFVEFDVRLTADQIPTVFHYTYLQEISTMPGLLSQYRYAQIENLDFLDRTGQSIGRFHVPRLSEVLEALAGRIGLEIEIKSLEPEAPALIAALLHDYRAHWEQIELTSYEPAILRDIHTKCPGLATDLLYPRSQPWMKLDIVAYEAVQRSRLARARGVHLHPTQLNAAVVEQVRAAGLAVHAWQVEDLETLDLVSTLKIPRFSTENIPMAVSYRQQSMNLT